MRVTQRLSRKSVSGENNRCRFWAMEYFTELKKCYSEYLLSESNTITELCHNPLNTMYIHQCMYSYSISKQQPCINTWIQMVHATEFILPGICDNTPLECMHLYRKARIQDFLGGGGCKSRRPLIQLNIPIQGCQLWGMALRDVICKFSLLNDPPPLPPPPWIRHCISVWFCLSLRAIEIQ